MVTRYFCLFALIVPAAFQGADGLPRPNPGGILGRLEIASFTGSGQNSIQALATDANGNIYVAGTTTSPNLNVKNAFQPNFGEATILRTTDLGATFTRIASPPDSSATVFPDPTAPSILFASGATGIYESADGGQTWRLVYSFPQSYSAGGAGLAVDPGNHLRVAAIVPMSGALIRSLDGGETWVPGSVSCPVSSCGGRLFADPGGSGALLMLSFGLYLSRDWGVTFQAIEPPGPGSPAVAAFDPSHPGWIYVGTSAGTLGAFWLSMDFGATWNAKASPPTTFSAMLTLAVDPGTAPSTLLAAAVDGLYKSTDGAASWVRTAGPGASFSLEGNDPFALLSGCASGGLAAIGSAGAGSFQVAFSKDYGASFMTPHLTGVTSVASGPSCAIYMMRKGSSDAFLSKLAPDGTAIWTTYFGGVDQDAPAGLALDAQGNAYVAGNTTSPDFPTTLPAIGPPGQSAVFVARFTAAGRLDYSVLIGGEARNTAVAIAVDQSGGAYVAGSTDSQGFPVSAGALVTKLDAGNYTGFLAKLTPAGALTYATYLGTYETYPGALLANDDGTVIVAGAGPAPQAPVGQGPTAQFVTKLNAAGSQVLASTYFPGFSTYLGGSGALATDGAGNLIVAVNSSGPLFPGVAGYTTPAFAGGCPEDIYSSETGMAVVKLAAADWSPIYSAMLGAPCGITAGPIAVDGAGSVVLGLATGRGLPLHNPLLAGPACFVNSSAVARLSADGSTLQFATYLDNCGAPGIALAQDGSVYAGVSAAGLRNPAGVLRLGTPAAPALSLDRVANAFSGNTNAVAFGGLYSLTGTGFQFPAMDLGLSPTRNLPDALGGVEVTFDGIPAPILQTAPGRVIVVAPQPAGRRQEESPRGFTTVQVFANGVASNAVLMPIAASQPGLLTPDYPNPPHAAYIDGVAHNADGTPNDAGHPAAAGSTITLFATGMGASVPAPAPGSIAGSQAAVPVTPVYSSLEMFAPSPNANPAPLTVSTAPRYVSAVFQVRVAVPASVQNLGTDAGNGVRRVAIALQFSVSPSSEIPPASNYVSVYLK